MADAPVRVLIAEDHPHGAELLEAYLAETPWDTKIAVNGEEAVKVARDWKPDIVLLDVMMPRLSGFEVCRTLRADPDNRDVGILMITALDQPSDVERALDAGTDDFLTKPIDKRELLLRINALLDCRKHADYMQRTFEYIRSVEAPRG